MALSNVEVPAGEGWEDVKVPDGDGWEDVKQPRQTFEPDQILVESPTDGMEEQDKAQFQQVQKPNDVAKYRARKYFEHKDNANYGDEYMLAERARKEMGMSAGSEVDYVGVVKYLTDVTAPYTKMKQENASVLEMAMGVGASFAETAKNIIASGESFVDVYAEQMGKGVVEDRIEYQTFKHKETGEEIRYNPREMPKGFLKEGETLDDYELLSTERETVGREESSVMKITGKASEKVQKFIDDVTPESWEKAREIMQIEAGKDIEGNIAQQGLQFMKQGAILLGDNAPNLVASRANPMLGYTIMYSNEKSSMYNHLTELGIDKELAENYSSMYGGASAPIEYVENAGRLIGAFGGRGAKKFATKGIKKATASMLKNMGINVAEEIGQDEIFNIISNVAILENNKKFGTSIKPKAQTWGDRVKTAKGSVQMSMVLDAIGIPTRYAKRRMDVNKTTKEISDTMGVNPSMARKFAIDLNMAETQEEYDLARQELEGYLEGKQDRIDTVTEEKEIPLGEIDESQPITQPDGTPWTDHDFDDINDNYTEEEINDMIEGETGEIFKRAVAGDANARAEYNRILVEGQKIEQEGQEQTSEQTAEQAQPEQKPSMLPAATKIAKQEVLPSIEEGERGAVEARLDEIIAMDEADAKIELERLHQAYPELSKSVDKYVMDAVRIAQEEGVAVEQETVEQEDIQTEEQKIEEKAQEERLDEIIEDTIPEGERATEEEKKEAEEKRAPGEYVRLTQEEGALIREHMDLDTLSPAERITWQARLDEAKQLGLDLEALSFANGVISKPRVITPNEHAALVLRSAQLVNSINAKLNEIQEGVLAGKEVGVLRDQLNEMYAELDVITRAGDISGTMAGQALNIRKMGISLDTYDKASIIQRARVSKGKELTAKQEKELIRLANEVKEWEGLAEVLQAEIDALNEQETKTLAEEVFNEEIGALKGRRNKEKTQSERKKIKNALKAMGYRFNDIVGVTAEGSALIAKLAVNYIKDGAQTLDEVVKRVQADMPDASAKNVYDALAGRHKNVRGRVRTELAKRTSELKSQANLMSKIEDAMNGIFDKKRTRRASSPEIIKLRKQLKELQKTAENTERSDKQLQKILDQIAQVEQDITENNFPPKKQKRSQDERIKEARKNLNELKRLLKTNEEIADLEERIKTGNYEGLFAKKTVEGVKNKELQDALVKVHQLKRQIRNKIHAMRKKDARWLLEEVAGEMRSVKAMADMSYALRQGIIVSAGHPILATKVFGQAFKSFFSANTADGLDLAMRSSEMQLQRDKYGLHLSSLDGALNKKEEMFASSLIDKVPMLGWLKKASERNMVIGLNMLRSSLFDEFIKSNPDASEAAKHAYARYINIMTGRGDMKGLTTSPVFQALLFSPKFTASRLQAIPVAAQTAIKHPETRKEVARQWASFVGLGMTTLFLAQLAGFDVGLDPDEPDFGKITINGRTRVDVFGGLQQPVRAFIRMAKAPFDDEQDSLWDISSQFFKYKVSPIVSTTSELFTGKDWVTNKDISRGEELAKVAVPLIFESAWESYKMDLPPEEAIIALGGEFLGLGVQTYEKKPKKRSKGTNIWN